MPRPNRPRTIGGERTLAQRVAFERESKGWTYENLAQRMTAVGCPIQKSALYKIEHGKPPRGVGVDEFVAFANVFELPLDELLVPHHQVLTRRAKSLVERWALARDAAGDAQRALEAADLALREHIRQHPDSRAAMKAALSDYARTSGHPDAGEATDYWSMLFRDVPKDSAEFTAWLDKSFPEPRRRPVGGED